MNRIFFHIPRTAGSSIWHGLAHLAAASNMDIIDIYHWSLKKYSDLSQSSNVLTAMQPLSNDRERIFHHHYPDYILNFIDEPVMATIVRDPVERFISDIFHYKRALVSTDISSFHKKI